MTGGLLQLAFKGPQDIYLTGNPQMTFFKSVYKQHSNFTKDTQLLQFENDIKLGTNHYCVIKRYGDLLSNLYLYIELPEITSADSNETWKGYVNGVGYSIIKSVSLDIGGLIIDKLDYTWLDIYNELYDQKSDDLIGKFNTDISLQENSNSKKLYIPLKFWFTKNPGLSIPLIALQYHEIKINIEFKNWNEIIKSNISNFITTNTKIKAHIIADYIHLDDNEKKFFTATNHEYLIEQLQILSEYDITNNTTTAKVPLDFSHPIKEIVWVITDNVNHSQNTKTGNNWLSYTSISSSYRDTFTTAKITMNGLDRTNDMSCEYYRQVIPYESYNYLPRKYIYCYSFSLNPTQFQPSGSCNYSKINKSYLHINFNPINNIGGTTNGRIKIYGTNYNILSIKQGMGGVLFMN